MQAKCADAFAVLDEFDTYSNGTPGVKLYCSMLVANLVALGMLFHCVFILTQMQRTLTMGCRCKPRKVSERNQLVFELAT
jgi:hypothetical protein